MENSNKSLEDFIKELQNYIKNLQNEIKNLKDINNEQKITIEKHEKYI